MPSKAEMVPGPPDSDGSFALPGEKVPSRAGAGLARTLLGLLGALACASVAVAEPALNEPPALSRARPGAILTADDDALLDELERRSFQFFVEQTNPVTGLVRDRARADGSPSEGKASIAASGFALTSWAIATHRGWVTRDEALARVRLMLRFLADKAPRHHGFFYHFMEMDTGARAWQCEVSSIDTGLFLVGAIVAREYFRDPEITELVNRLYREVDWPWFLNGGTTLSMGWHDETGFSRYRWSFYSEHTMMSILGLGAPEHPLPPEYWRTWKRWPTGTYAGYHFIQGPPLFIHQYAHAYVDFRERRDAFANYYHNSVLATLAQRRFCMDLRSEFPTWSERLWGISASDSSTGYKAWGGPPRTAEFNALDGTIVPCAAAGSVPFAPYETIMVLHHIRTVYGDRTWLRYGFVDAFNPETGWVDTDVIGIDVGISLIQAENARSGFTWALFMQAPEVSRALAQAGFISAARNFTWPQRQQLRALADRAWQSLEREPVSPETLGLRLTAVPAAQVLGLIDGAVAYRRSRALLAENVVPTGDVAVAEYAAGLVTLRQAFPSLASDATRALEAIKWGSVTIASTKLGSASRLAAFFKIAAGKSETATWTRLVRTPEARGPVFVLSPPNVPDQLRPGLWLDERATIAGASAEQLAYSLTIPPPVAAPAADGPASPPGDAPASDTPTTPAASATEPAPRTEKSDTPPPTPAPAPATLPPPAGPSEPPLPDVVTSALLLDHFPMEWLERFHDRPPPDAWLASAPPADRAILLISLANLLVPDCVREWFQQDPVVQSGRATLQEFADAAFGSENSTLWRYELAGPFVEPPERRAVAVASTLPREQWSWTTIAGLEYKDSPADVRADDPLLELRFAFTWDNQALHFHAEATDTPPNYQRPPERREQVELLVDPKGDGHVWRGADDFDFVFRSNGDAREWSHNRPAPATIKLTEHGYTVDADLPWSVLGLTPAPGLEIALSPAVATGGRYEWEPSLKLNWRYFERRDERFGLGTLELK